MKEVIASVLHKALKKEGIEMKEEKIGKLLEIPPSSEFGDYAFPCFSFSEKLKQAPNEIAINIRGHLGASAEGLADIQTKGPYINFFLDREKIARDLIKEISEKRENYGSMDIGKGKKALIEHTSINPNASPHVGRARNAIIGDSLVRILKFLNYKTEVHYYVNDVSKQIAMLVAANAEKLKFSGMLKSYVKISGKVDKSKKLENEVFNLLYRFEGGDKEVVKKFRRISETCVKGQAEIFSGMGIHYDYFDYESSYIPKSKQILSELEKTGKLFRDEAGRLVLNQKGTSVEKSMKSPVLVLTRNDGTGLYPLRDIAYTIDKIKTAPKENIIILGEDQKLYFQQVSEALKLLNFSAPKAVHYSFILLNDKGKSKKMSTRKGDVVLLERFLGDAISKAKKEIAKRKTKGSADKIGIGAVKYAILKNSPNKSILFNLGDALNFEGDSGAYILYSYARASSIIKKARKKLEKHFAIDRKLELHEFELVRKMLQFREVVLSSYINMNPSLIANYSYQLAQLFNEFYHACPVINSEENETFRLYLVDAFRIVLKNSLHLLGIETMEEM